MENGTLNCRISIDGRELKKAVENLKVRITPQKKYFYSRIKSFWHRHDSLIALLFCVFAVGFNIGYFVFKLMK